MPADDEFVSVRCMDVDVEAAVAIYTSLRLLLSGPESPAGRPMPTPEVTVVGPPIAPPA